MTTTSNENLYWLLEQAFLRNPQGVALRIPQAGSTGSSAAREWRYGELAGLAAQFATELAALGIVPGDRVLVQVDKSPEAVGLYLGCLRVGAVFVPINTAYTVAEVDYFLQDAEPRLFVCRQKDEAAATLRLEAAGVVVRALAGAGDGDWLASVLAHSPSSQLPVARRDATDLAAILYTSGTTGRSKGAMLSHGNLAASAVMLVDCWGWRADDVLLHALPIFHVHGLFVALHCALVTATPMVFLPGFDLETMVAQLPHATVMMGVPTFYTRMLQHGGLTREACAAMRLFVSGSAPLTEQTFEAWEARTGHRILERYGMSETMMNTSNPLMGDRVPGTVGYPLPGVEVRVTGEDGRQLGTEEVGVLEVRGPNVFSGYWRMPEKTAEEFRGDGFFVTGDLATINDVGRVTLVGRAKDLVISGGYNVYPKEIERLLDDLPEIKESAVIGLPHADFGEAVAAVIVPVADPVDVQRIDAALAGSLARFKQPKCVFNVSELPRNAMGKVQKNVLRDRYAATFDQGDA